MKSKFIDFEFVEHNIKHRKDVDKKLRVVCISDTHNKHEQFGKLPDGDVLVHTGDFTDNGSPEEVRAFAAWFESQPHKHKLVISGNHDVSWAHKANLFVKKVPKINKQYKFSSRTANKFFTKSKYLSNEFVNIEGIKFYGVDWVKRSKKLPKDET
eukprot:UN00176